ncbi:MAG: hypothetical protein PUJ51_22235 [Clostridiales bacterium]|uniref:hypothetical protein n=1 Tax=Terrisporobacter sp. TaxID=1965305 RepID=UPI002A50A21A|nr:hypothetical protein [Terrisporobacter sp.]MDD7757175.1 hypothetical protein [Clostridiales bacterium]MDY4137691.1 hypothetical protein [Terrisporobacter sp.]
MKKHTKEFKSSISTFGRELDSKIFVLGTELVLEKEDLFSITPVVNSEILKTIMKEVDFESKKQIGIGQEVNVKSGVKVNGKYEYIDYGNYSVYKSEYKAETDTYSHICYDKMLKTMIDYTPLDITYPINLREYINAIATKCGLEFADKNSTFANYNTSINEDHFSNGNYTFRDVLDYIAQLVGGWFCINNDDKLEIRYPKLARNYGEANGEDVSFTSNVEDEINTIIVDGKSTQATSTDPVTPSPDNPSEIECVKGKNLFDYTKLNNENTVQWKAYENLGTMFRALPIYVGANKQIYFSSNIPALTTRNAFYAINNINEGSSNILNVDNSKVVSSNSDGYVYLGVVTNRQYYAEVQSNEYWIMISTDNQPYLPYNTIQIKNTGKNLLNIFENYTSGQSITSNGITYKINEDGTITANGTATANSGLDIYSTKSRKSIKKGTYTLSGSIGGTSSTYRIIIRIDKEYFSINGGTTFTINEDASYYMTIRIYKGTTVNNLVFKPMIEKGTQATAYEPYQESILNIDLQGNELCSLPNNVKDELVIENGRAKIIKNVGKTIVAKGDFYNGTTWNGYFVRPEGKINTANDRLLCDRAIANRTHTDGTMYENQANVMLVGSNTDTIETLKAKYDGAILYYQLATLTEIDLGEVDTLSTFKGVNNVSLDANMQTNMNLIYTAEYEELDKHFLKDVNVSFSKKYGAVNSVVFSRGNGSDNIYRKDNASINKNGLTEIKIADNPFLEGDDRENFIQQLFDKINGLEFYIMDVASTGIMYLELGDLYYFNMIEEKPSLKSGLVKSGMRKAQGSSGGKFLCLLMNDEIKITQGLEENIYSDEPEITETNYKTASITDTSIKNAIIQTNKNSAEILLKVNNDEVVSAINLSPENIKISSAKLDIDAIATFTNSKLAEAGSTVINGANITTGSINCDRLNGGTINGQAIRGGSISIEKGVYYFNMGTSTSNPNCSGLNVGGYGIKAYSDITATGFAITDSDTGKSQSINIYDGHGKVWYLTFTGGILTASEYK